MRYNGPIESCIHLMCKSWWVCAYANTDDTITTIKTVDISNTSHKLLPISSSEIMNPKPHTVSLRHHKTLKSPLDSKEIQPVHPKGNQLNIPWKDWCWSWNSNTLATWCEELTHWKRPWCWERLKAGGKGMREDEMFGWHHLLSGHEFEQASGVGDEQGSLVCCSPWGCKQLDSTERLIWTELNWTSFSEIMNPTQFTESYRFQLYIHSYFTEHCFPASACKLASLFPGAELWWTVVLDTTHFCPLPLSWGRNCRVVHLLIPQSCAAHHNLLLLFSRLLLVLICVLSRFSCVQLFATPWTVDHQFPLSMGLQSQTRLNCLSMQMSTNWEVSLK